ncbi:MAG: hypothetical protein LBD09_00670 [Treponema sp.]|jgi:hypothetical protein|nr:hypothetical protein [Treponema sp.]
MKNGTNMALDRNRPFHGIMKRAPFSVSPLTHRILFLSFSVAILALAGCFSPYSGDEATITINGNMGRFLYDPDPNNTTYVANQLTRYEVILDGPSKGTYPFDSGRPLTMKVDTPMILSREKLLFFS